MEESSRQECNAYFTWSFTWGCWNTQLLTLWLLWLLWSEQTFWGCSKGASPVIIDHVTEASLTAISTLPVELWLLKAALHSLCIAYASHGCFSEAGPPRSSASSTLTLIYRYSLERQGQSRWCALCWSATRASIRRCHAAKSGWTAQLPGR